MSHKHPKVNARQLIKILAQKGFSFSRQSGSHAIYIDDEGLRTTIPIHGKKRVRYWFVKANYERHGPVN
ncbi:addiction module toxin, HicA family [Spirosoma sp. HMF4905]|uniref:Addiction module toxin, HicA family n=1 Tax=Spirosoma arboris TaxID=2682092 RepID=A0A7K1SDG4_9BACT|nr:addiction module toxin, HicA family [Spirosoma arboris]